jgi:TolA-binding protein
MKPTKQVVKKDTPKELETKGSGTQFVESIKSSSRYIAGAILLVLVLGVAFLGWWYYRANREEKALALEYQGMKAYHEAGTSEDKANELYPKAVATFDQILTQYSGTKSAQRALFYKANSYYLAGSYDEAIREFSQYLEKYPRGEFFIASAKGVGYAYEQKGDYQKALEAYQRFQDKISSASDKAEILLAIARCQEALGQIQEAIATYEKIESENLPAAWKRTVEERLKVLKKQQTTGGEP